MKRAQEVVSDQWCDALHEAIMAIVGHINRPEPDARILTEAGVEMEPWLFPALSRIGLGAPISVVELGRLLGKDHSTISRQVAKLEAAGLVERAASDLDQRVRLLRPSERGAGVLDRIGAARREAMSRWFASWNSADRATLLELLERMVDQADA